MFQSYLEIRALPLDGESSSRGDAAFVMRMIMKAIHLHIADGNEVAVAFPGFCDEIERNDVGRVTATIGVGDVIRVFGSDLDLMSFLVRPEFASLIGGGACSVGKTPIRKVPEGAATTVYSRSRKVEKCGIAYADRVTRRGERCNRPAELIAERYKKASEKTYKKLPPYVHMDSISTGKQFRIFIEKDAPEFEVRDRPNSYGLGVAVPDF